MKNKQNYICGIDPYNEPKWYESLLMKIGLFKNKGSKSAKVLMRKKIDKNTIKFIKSYR